MNKEIKYIVVTGVESTGKSTLCEALAAHFKEPFVSEVARAYLTKRNGIYEYQDIEEIAKLHWKEIELKSLEAKKYLFIDTAFLVLKIWSEEKYGKCCRFILDKLATFEPNLYLLPAIDIPYEKDPLREAQNEIERKRLYYIYLAHLQSLNFITVSGTKKERLKIAAQYVLSV